MRITVLSYFSDFFERYRNRPFLKSSIILISGTAVGQLIPIVTAPIITRIYSPDNYGLFGIFLLISNIIGLFSTMQMENAILIEKEERQATAVLQLCFLSTISVSLLSFLLLFYFRSDISHYFSSQELSPLLLLLPVVVCLTGLNNSITAWANRKLLYKAISFQRLCAAIITPLISISIGLAFKSVIGLFAGMICGQLLGFIILYYKCLKGRKIFVHSNIRLYKIVKRHKSFPKYVFPSEFINMFISQFPGFVLGRYYSIASVGQFNLSNRMLNLPTMIVSQAIGEVFKKRSTIEFHSTGKCIISFKKTFIFLSLLSILPFVLLFFLGPYIFSFVFGAKWEQAGVFTRIMALMFFLRFTISPLTFVTILRNKQIIGLVGTIVYALTTVVVCYLIARNSSNVNYMLIGYVLNFTWVYLIMFYLNFKLSKGDEIFPRSHSIS